MHHRAPYRGSVLLGAIYASDRAYFDGAFLAAGQPARAQGYLVRHGVRVRGVLAVPVADGLDFVHHLYVIACRGSEDGQEALGDLYGRLATDAKPGDPARRASVLSAVLAAGGE